MWKKQEPSQHQICRHNIRRQKFIWEHRIWCHVKISEAATLVSVIPNFWCCLEAAAIELHLCFVIKGYVWWKRTFPMVTIAVLHHKHMKLFKPFTPHVIAWSVRKSFNHSIRRTSGATPSVFPLDLVFFHFIWCSSSVFLWISSAFFMSELNVTNCTILCNCNCNWDFLI